MKKLIILFALMLPVTMTGCQSLGSGFVEGAEEQLRLKWAEEWRPAIEAKFESSLEDAQDALLAKVASDLEHQEDVIMARLASVNVRLEDFDKDKDGNVTGTEAAALMATLKDAKDKDGNSLGWYEVLMAVVLGYGGTTGAKEWMKSRMSGTESGTQTA